MVLSACWVESINGLDEGDLLGPADRDRVFEPALLGKWAMQEDKCTVTISIIGDKNEYVWRETREGHDCGDSGGETEIYYRSTLYKLDGHLFLDLTARPEDVCDVCRAMHEIFLVQIGKDSVTFAPIDSEWLGKAVKAKTVTLATLANNTDTITATPKELKGFCRQYADNKEVFKPEPEFILKRK